MSSPCIGVCRIEDGRCAGCRRTPEQIRRAGLRAELADLRRRHADQLAYGVKGTSTANRIARLEDELRPGWVRLARFYGTWLLILAYCAVFWLAVGAGIWQYLSPLIRAMMGQG